MKYCEHCGSELKSGVEFCSNCGAKVGSKSEKLTGEVVNNTNTTKTGVKDNTTVLAFVCSLIGLLCCCSFVSLPGLILSIVSLVNMRDGKISNEKKGLAIAALVISIFTLLMTILGLFVPNYNQEMINELRDQFNVNYG